jgi:hypothetical protein
MDTFVLPRSIRLAKVEHVGEVSNEGIRSLAGRAHTSSGLLNQIEHGCDTLESVSFRTTR